MLETAAEQYTQCTQHIGFVPQFPILVAIHRIGRYSASAMHACTATAFGMDHFVLQSLSCYKQTSCFSFSKVDTSFEYKKSSKSSQLRTTQE